MAGGFLKGAILGGFLSLGAAIVISVLVPLPNPPDVVAVAPEREAPAAVPVTAEAESAAGADTAPEPAQATAPTPAPEADTVAVVAATETPAAAPETGAAEALQPLADTPIDVAQAPAPDTPVLPNPQALAPMAPQGVDRVLVTTEPAELPTPLSVAPETSFSRSSGVEVTELPSPEGASVQAPPQPLPLTSPDTRIAEPQAPMRVIQETVEEQPAEIETAVVDTVPADVATDGVQPGEVDPAEVAVAVDPTPVPEAPAPIQPEAVADVDEGTANVQDTQEPQKDTVIAAADISITRDNLQSNETSRPSTVRIGKPAVNLVDRAGGVKINRSPGLATVSASEQTPSDGDSSETAATSGLPIRKYANAFDNPEERPLMSIVLMDTGAELADGDVDFAALASFPYPLSLAVDTSLPDAAARMARYREEGFEVLAMVDLPEGAAPTDAEVAMGVILDRVPEVVGVLEGTKGGLQGSREVSDQVTEILLQSGHGLVSQSQGLNTMPKLARKLGVPAKPVFRDFDSKGQQARVIRRFLDQAAFKAGQEGGVIMLGRIQPETIKALLLWGLADRASQVALAPVSAVLLRD